MARHRKVKNRKLRKFVTSALAVGVLSTGIGLQSTSSSFIDTAQGKVTANAERWVPLNVAIQGYNTAVVTWTPLAGYSSYTLEYAKSASFDYPKTLTVTGSSITIDTLNGASGYHWRMKPVNAPDSINWSLDLQNSTQNPNATVQFGDILAYSHGDKAIYNYGKSSANMPGASRKVIISNAPAPQNLFVTDWNGDGIADVFIKNPAGTGSLEVHLGKAGGGFTKVTVGSGTWNEYDITVGHWWNSSRLPMILAIEKSTGILYTYANPNGTQHGGRTNIGVGWNNFVINIVDWDMDGNQDVVAKIPNTGELRLYRGTGSSGFINETRAGIGSGWNVLDSIGYVEDSERPDSRGFIAREIASSNIVYYPIGAGFFGNKREIGKEFWNYKISGS